MAHDSWIPFSTMIEAELVPARTFDVVNTFSQGVNDVNDITSTWTLGHMTIYN